MPNANEMPIPRDVPTEKQSETGNRNDAFRLGIDMGIYADFETERNVLACILADPNCIVSVMEIFSGVAPISGEIDLKSKIKKIQKNEATRAYCDSVSSLLFYDPKYREIFSSILSLYHADKDLKKGVDILSIHADLVQNEKSEAIGGMQTLLSIQQSVSNSANLEAWCNILLDWGMMRETIRACNSALHLAKTPGKNIHELLDEIETTLFSVRNSFIKEKKQDIGELMNETFAYFMRLLNKDEEPGLSTGYPDLDHILGGGLKKQEMIVLAARPSIGKTAFALNIARNIVMKNVEGKPRSSIVFFSLEQSAQSVCQRLLCTEAKIPLSSIMDRSFAQTDLVKLTAAVSTWSNTRLFIDATGGLTLYELRAKARKLKDDEGIDLIIIDYLQLMHTGESMLENRQVEVANISNGIKKLAKDLDVPVLVLSQLNREAEGAKAPNMSNIRESGSIEQDADVVILLHRDRDATKESGVTEGKAQQNHFGGGYVDTQVIVEKNRNGKTGRAILSFDAPLMEFRSKRYESDIPFSVK